MNKPKVTIGVILFKDTKYLAHSLTSLLDQDYENIEYILRDQSPDGEVYAYLEEAHPEFFKKAIVTKGENVMHSGGHNEMIRHMKGEYYICASNDMLYTPDFVSKSIEEMINKGAKVATPRLMKWDFKKALAGDVEGSKTNIIDSYGISITRYHNFVDAGEGVHESDLERIPPTLGPSGALGIFHKDALKEIAYKNAQGKLEYFDELMHYKNDCDLAYRITWAGIPCLLTSAKVYHDRQVGQHAKKSKFEFDSSHRGQLVTMKKNMDKGFSLMTKLRAFFFLLLRRTYILFFRPRTFKVCIDVNRLRKEIKKRKKAIKKNISPKDIESLMI